MKATTFTRAGNERPTVDCRIGGYRGSITGDVILCLSETRPVGAQDVRIATVSMRPGELATVISEIFADSTDEQANILRAALRLVLS